MINLIKPQDFFAELLEPAKLSVPMRTYLVDLLIKHIPTSSLLGEEGDRAFPTLTFLYKDAVEAPASLRPMKYQKLGDTSLMIAGFYPHSLNRKLVDIDYFSQMGSLAYSQVSSAGVFPELASNFTKAMDALGYVSDVEVRREQDILRLMELYALMPTERLYNKLKALGIPVTPMTRVAQ